MANRKRVPEDGAEESQQSKGISPKRVTEDGPQESQQSKENSPNIDDPKFLEQISEQLKARGEHNKHILLNIPIWGWTGDGKTCALLTAIHFCDPAQHPLSFAPITDPDELVSLESSVEDYKGLNLAGTALATAARFRELARLFIDRNDWPPGTDQPSSYILGIRSVTSTLGYVLFPDLKGGSYRELDDAARNVLRRAHAAVLLVNPEMYHEKTTDGKRYRDEILLRLHEFGEADVPVCVMVTKADRYEGQHAAADETQKELTVLIEQQESLVALLCRVSVIGPPQTQGDALPVVAERHPDNMVKAWIWVVAQALCRSVEVIRRLLPLVNVRGIGNQSADLKLQPIPELRQIGDFSGSPGRVLYATNDDPHSRAFTFLSDQGELLETIIGAGPQPQFKPVGSIPEWNQADVRCCYISGELLIGPRSKCNFVWQGTKGGQLTKVPLPYEMASWVPMTPRRILGIDVAGRLHSLKHAGDRWIQTDFIENFILPTAYLTCAFVERSSHVLVFNGTTVEGAAVDAEGDLGTRVAPGYVIQFDTPRATTNRLGLCLAISTSGAGFLGGPTKPIEVGPVKVDAEAPIALAPHACIVAAATPDLRLIALSVVGAQVTATATSHSPQLDANPQSMAWTQNGEVLAVSFEDKTWRVFRPFGLSI